MTCLKLEIWQPGTQGDKTTVSSVKIGCIGPLDSVNVIQKIVESYYPAVRLFTYVEEKSDAAISGFGAVYENLKQKQVPVFRLYPSGFQIWDNMKKLLGRIGLKICGLQVLPFKLFTLKVLFNIPSANMII